MSGALDLFSKRGFESVGVQEIADGALVTKPSLYYYFKSKQGLLEAIVAEHGADLRAVIQRAATYQHKLSQNLAELFRETVNFAHRDTAFFRLSQNLFSSAAETTGYAVGSPLRQELVFLLELLFSEAAADHGTMEGREYVYAETFWGIVEAWAMLSINGETKIDEQLQYRIIHNYMHGIFSSSAF
jgi:TetR/AcrR family transcriptional regulator